jgi:DNA-directed RNA polymerase specialized sigma subunit
MFELALENVSTISAKRGSAGETIFYQAAKARDSLIARGIEPTDKAIAKELGVSLESIQSHEILKGKNFVRIDAKTNKNSEEGRTWQEVIGDNSANPEELYAAKEEINALKLKIAEFRSKLSDRQRVILDEYILGSKTVREVAKELSISKSYVDQLAVPLEEDLHCYLRKHLSAP